MNNLPWRHVLNLQHSDCPIGNKNSNGLSHVCTKPTIYSHLIYSNGLCHVCIESTTVELPATNL